MLTPRLFTERFSGRFSYFAMCLAGLLAYSPPGQTAPGATPPKAGPVQILKLSQIRPGMKATAWTAFEGNTAEPVPVEVLGVMKNSLGPGQDVIMAKLGGKAAKTNVAAGMSGSPVYHDGKLIGAISLRYSVFSPDTVAGITPIELMLDIDELDRSRPFDAMLSKPSDSSSSSFIRKTSPSIYSGEELALKIWNSVESTPAPPSHVVAIETPLAFSGVHDDVLNLFDGHFRKAGVVALQGGGSRNSPQKIADDISLNPGEPLAAVLVTGDLSVSALGTVTYNDGKRVLAFGHSLFNVGPIEMPMAGADVLTVLASKFSPLKLANSADIVGALRQDRHSGILGVLGDTASMIPVAVRVRQLDSNEIILSEKSLQCEVFQNTKWTPSLLTLVLYNSVFQLNDFAEENTFRLTGRIDLGNKYQIPLRTMRTSNELPVPTPLVLASWVGVKAHRLFSSSGEDPTFRKVDITVDLIPEKRIVTIDHAWLEKTTVRPGDVIRGKVFLRPYRGKRVETRFEVQIPPNTPKGNLRFLASDAETLNRAIHTAVSHTKLPSLSDTVSLLNKERSNDQLFISLFQPNFTARLTSRTLPNLPLSVLNVMGQSSKNRLWLEHESLLEQFPIAFNSIVNGSYDINLKVQ